MPWVAGTQGHYILTTILIRFDVSTETAYLMPARAKWNPSQDQTCLNRKKKSILAMTQNKLGAA